MVVPTEKPISLSRASVEPPPMVILVSALALVRTSRLEALIEAETPVVPLWASMAPSMAAAFMPAVMVILVPLMTSVPPAEVRPEMSTVPVATAAASGDSVAPEPRIFAGCGGPATGLAEKFAGLSSSEPATSVSWSGVNG